MNLVERHKIIKSLENAINLIQHGVVPHLICAYLVQVEEGEDDRFETLWSPSPLSIRLGLSQVITHNMLLQMEEADQ